MDSLFLWKLSDQSLVLSSSFLKIATLFSLTEMFCVNISSEGKSNLLQLASRGGEDDKPVLCMGTPGELALGFLGGCGKGEVSEMLMMFGCLLLP